METIKERQFIKFKLGESNFGFPIEIIHKIVPKTTLTRVPYTQDYFIGITNLRGEILSIVDLKKFLEITPSTTNKEEDLRIIITNKDGHLLGFLVDKVYGVQNIKENDLNPPPLTLNDRIINYVEFITGEKDDFMIILDFATIINNMKFIV